MKIMSAVLSFVLTLFVAAEVAAQHAPRMRAPRTNIDADVAVASALAARVRSEACAYAGSVSCDSSRSSTTSSCTDGEYYADFWQLPVTSGQRISLTVTETTAYEILVAIHRPSDSQIVATNNGNGSVTTSYTFPTSGTYVISVGFLTKYYRGAYNLSASCASTGGGQCQVSAHLTKGVPLTTDLGNSTACSDDGSTYSKVFSFDAVAGEPVEITVNGSVGIWIEAYADLDDSYSGMSYVLPGIVDLVYFPRTTGRHFVWVAPSDSKVRSGSYTVVIDDIEFGACKRRVVRH